jgi:hypothetical protein
MKGALRGEFQTRLYQRTERISARNWEPLPGIKITKAMIIPQLDNEIICPRLGCSSKIHHNAPAGGKIWFVRSLHGRCFALLKAQLCLPNKV